MAVGETGRNPLTSRSTAEGAAALRAAAAREHDPAVRGPDHLAERFLGGFNATTLAKLPIGRELFVREVNRRLPGAYPYEHARTCFMDEIVETEVAAGIDQLVLLGAGFDSRAFRMTELLAEVRVFEVDHPATQRTKRRLLGGAVGRIPENLEFVAVDFTAEDFRARLEQSGHDRSARTLFIWSGVAPYLPEQAVAEVLEWIASHPHSRTTVVFDVIWREAIEGTREYYGSKELCRTVAAAGEPLIWGVPEGGVESMLDGFGLTPLTVIDDESAGERFLTRSDGTLLGRPYGCGALIHARAGGRGQPSPSSADANAS